MRMLALAHIRVRSLRDFEKSGKNHNLAHKADLMCLRHPADDLAGIAAVAIPLAVKTFRPGKAGFMKM